MSLASLHSLNALQSFFHVCTLTPWCLPSRHRGHVRQGLVFGLWTFGLQRLLGSTALEAASGRIPRARRPEQLHLWGPGVTTLLKRDRSHGLQWLRIHPGASNVHPPGSPHAIDSFGTRSPCSSDTGTGLIPHRSPLHLGRLHVSCVA